MPGAEREEAQRPEGEDLPSRPPGKGPEERERQTAGERHRQAQRPDRGAEQGDKGHGEIAQQRVLPAAPAYEQHGQGVHVAVDAVIEYGPGVVKRARLVLIEPGGQRRERREPQGKAQRE